MMFFSDWSKLKKMLCGDFSGHSGDQGAAMHLTERSRDPIKLQHASR